MFDYLSSLNKAIDNEVALDIDSYNRINNATLKFIPIRPLKTYRYFQKIPFVTVIYNALNFLFIFLCPLLFLIQLIQFLHIKSKLCNKSTLDYQVIVLVANSRTLKLSNNIQEINQSNTLFIHYNEVVDKFNNTHILQFIKTIDILKIFFLSIGYVLIKTPKIIEKQYLQYYIAFDWLVKYRALSSINFNKNTSIYFSNHYDRWAVQFDMVLYQYALNVIQHGKLPDKLELPYKLSNINCIYTIDDLSRDLFSKLYNLDDCVIFFRIESTLDVKETPYKRSILIIGQPESVERELLVINKLIEIDNIDKIFIKPHPLFSYKVYIKINSAKVDLIRDPLYFPKVNLAFNNNSTLGQEYASLGIPVLNIYKTKLSEINPLVNQILHDN